GVASDLYVLPDPLGQGRARAPSRFASSSSYGEFSPDGRWIAYEQFTERLDDTQVYIGSINEPRRRQVSSRAGTVPRWRGDSRELFYVENDTRQVMAVDVDLGGKELRIGTPHPLPLPRLRSTGGLTFDVSRDGQRFLAVLAGD